jgi:hypothetical protein
MPSSPRMRVAVISFASSGDNIVVTAGAVGPINIYGVAFTVAGATNITFKNGTTAQSGAFVFTGNGSALSFPPGDTALYYADPGANFVINSSNAVQVSGTIWYANG